MITNPFILFSCVWLTVLFLYSLGLSQVLTPLHIETILLVCGSIIAFLAGWVFICALGRQIYIRPKVDLNFYAHFISGKKIVQRIKLTALLWALGSLFEVMYFGGVPFLSNLGVGAELRYTEFGISGLHGLLNALYLILVLFFYTRWLLLRSKMSGFFLVCLLLWPILLMTRQLMLSAIVQIVLLYICFKPVRPAVYFWILLGGIFTVILFGYIGDMRSGRESFLAVAEPSFEYPDSWPTGFMWVYVYLVSPLNNINYNIMNVEPYYFPVNLVLGVLPALVRDNVSSMFGVVDQIQLVNANLNVSSFYAKLLQDFGVFFSPIFLFIVSIFSNYLMANCYRKPGYLFALVVVLHGLVFSVFADLLFHLVFIFEILVFFIVFQVDGKSESQMINEALYEQ